MNELGILLVDDEPMVLEGLAEELLRNFGQDCQIEAAESGEEALEILEEVQGEGIEIAVVISDQLMPGIKGDELLSQIHLQYPDILKIMLTGQAEADAVGNAVNSANLYRYIAKPWADGFVFVWLSYIQPGFSTWLFLHLPQNQHFLQRVP